MADKQNSNVKRLVTYLMGKIAEVADEEDWKESDGWVGKWTIIGEHDTTLIYEIKNGKFNPTAEHAEYTGEVEMSEDTFLDLVEGALSGHGEDTFAQKYAKRAIRYTGSQWVVDSERFRKVLRRIGSEQVRKLI
jgi:hypothetical protein